MHPGPHAHPADALPGRPPPPRGWQRGDLRMAFILDGACWPAATCGQRPLTQPTERTTRRACHRHGQRHLLLRAQRQPQDSQHVHKPLLYHHHPDVRGALCGCSAVRAAPDSSPTASSPSPCITSTLQYCRLCVCSRAQASGLSGGRPAWLAPTRSPPRPPQTATFTRSRTGAGWWPPSAPPSASASSPSPPPSWRRASWT